MLLPVLERAALETPLVPPVLGPALLALETPLVPPVLGRALVLLALVLAHSRRIPRPASSRCMKTIGTPEAANYILIIYKNNTTYIHSYIACTRPPT